LARSIKKAVNQASVTIGDIKKIQIEIPPLAEQQRIAAILDKAHEIKCSRELAIKKLDELAQSVFYDLFGEVDNFIPLANLIKDKVKHLETKADMVWSLSLEQIESNTGRLLEKVMVPKAALGTSTYFFKPPVILYSKLRPYLNKVITPSEDGYATTELVPLYIKEDILRQSFLTSYLRSKYFVEFANTNSGGAKMPRVMMDKLWQHPVPIPSLESQIKFEKIFNVIKDKRVRLESSHSKTLNLISSLQSQAFSG
jgi:type I restriction enzyme S subunit